MTRLPGAIPTGSQRLSWRRKRGLEHLEKVIYFYSGWARYDLAVPGTFRLVPPEARLSELRRDYEATKIMVFGEPPAIEDILSALARLEVEINGPG